MAKCVYCGQRKGKRACPGLKGDICTQCCGTHRLQAIQCPADCAYLGGLAVLVGGGAAPAGIDDAAVEEAMDDACRAFHDWASANVGEHAQRVRQVLPLVDIERSELLGTLAGLLINYGVRDAGGKRLVERFLERKARDLTPVQVVALGRAARQWASVFRMTSEAGVVADLVDGKRITLQPSPQLSFYKEGAAFYGWILPVGGDRLALAVGAPLVDADVQSVLEDYGNLLQQLQERPEHAGKTHRELSGELGAVVPRILRSVIASDDGGGVDDGDMVHVTMTIKDERVVQQRLRKVPGLTLDAQFNMWRWRMHGNPAYAAIIVTNGILDLVTDDEERAQECRAIVEGALGDQVLHSFMDGEFEALPRACYAVSDEGAMGRALDAEPAAFMRMPGGADEGWGVRRPADGRPLGSLWMEDDELVFTPASDDDFDDGVALVEQTLGALVTRLDDDAGDDAVDIEDDGGPLPIDFNKGPDDAAAWLALDEDEQAALLVRYHLRAQEPHPEAPGGLLLHARMHALIESTLAQGQLAEATAALARLTAEGLTRHEAIHALASVIVAQIFEASRAKRAVDEAALRAEITQLTAKAWRESQRE